jgi:RHS repeat-associated protein
MARQRRKLSGQKRHKTSRFEQLEERRMLTSNWNNALSPLDVSVDGVVTQADVALITAELARPQTSRASDGALPANYISGRPFFDVDCDGFVSPIDAVRVRNWLRETGWQTGEVIGSITNTLFPNWGRQESGGSDGSRGTIVSEECAAVLTEGDSFYVGIEAAFTAPADAAALRFVFDPISFDPSDAAGINDALEIALLDENGVPLTQGFAPGRDAAFNLTEGLPAASGPGVVVNGNEILLGLGGLAAGTRGKIVVRFINNDSDTGTSVTLRHVSLVPSDLDAIPAESFEDQLPSVGPMPTEPPQNFDASLFLPVTSIGTNTSQLSFSTESEIRFDDFSTGLQRLAVNGDAAHIITQDGDVIRLAHASTFRGGSIFSETTLDARQFHSSFTFRITDPGGLGGGADGIVFVIQAVSSSLGGTGGGIGYAGIPRSVGVEFDTFDNGGNEPGSNHVGIDLNGNVGHESGSPFSVGVTPNFDNGEIWHAWVDYDGEILEVRVSPSFTRPEAATVSRPLDVPSIIQSDRAFAGFTAATGAGWGNHDILSWGYSEGTAITEAVLSISATAPAAVIRAGVPLTLSGLAELVEGNPPGTEFDRVTVNGRDVGVLHASGLFNAVVDIAAGPNVYDFVAYTNDGRTVTTQLVVEGLADQAMSIVTGLFDDLTADSSSAYGRTSFVESADLLDVLLALTNTADHPVRLPLYVGITNISDPSVIVAGLSGFTTDGVPYYEIGNGGDALDVGDATPELTLSFYNPNRLQFTYDLVVLSPRNSAPEILSFPEVTTDLGEDYRYPVLAYDRDGDALQYRLAAGPTGATIGSDGVLTWPAGMVGEGMHPFTVIVSDGYAEGEQEFLLSVTRQTTSSIAGVKFQDFNENGVRDAAIFAAGAFQSFVDFEVLGTDAVYLAGLDGLVIPPLGIADPTFPLARIPRLPPDNLLETVPKFVAVTGGDVIRVSDPAIGGIDNNPGLGAPGGIVGPEGISFGMNLSSAAGLSGFLSGRGLALVGVFLDDSDPRTSEAPPTLDFTASGVGTNFRTLAPGLKQVFFIGDGVDSNGVPQEFVAPAGATRLFLGIPDGSFFVGQPGLYEDNDGSYRVRLGVNQDPRGMIVNDAGLSGFRIYIDGNENDQFDAGELFAVTQSDGSYEFPNLGAGRYVVREDGKPGWKQTGPAGGEYVIDITSGGQRFTGVDFANARVAPDNAPPEINSTPPTSAIAGATYRYQVIARDPEGETPIYSLVGAPTGMTIDPSGLITWPTTPATADAGPITLTVADSRGQTVTQTWSIDVVPDETAPTASIEVFNAVDRFGADGVVDFDTEYSVRVRGVDNVGIRRLQLFVDGAEVQLDANGLATLQATAIGTKNLRAVATDPTGLTGEATGAVQIVDAADNNRPLLNDPDLPPHPGFDPTDIGRPLVDLISPALGDTVAHAVPIIGTVDDSEDNLWYYQVYYARADLVSITSIDVDDPDWQLIAQSTEEVINGELAILDASLLSANAYSILLVAFDVNGLGYADPTTVHVEGNVQLGNFHLEFADLTIPLSGIPITITRVYDTVNAGHQGDFGFAWTLGIQDPQIVESVTLGVGGGLNYTTDKFVPDKTKVYLTNPSGDRVGFTYREEFVLNSLFGALLRPYFEPDPGVYDTLTIDETQVIRGGFAGALTAGINPDAYALTTKDGLVYRYGQTAGLQSIRDSNGNGITVTPSGIIHSSGEVIQFRRDAAGRITEIIDPAGNTLHYVYDTAGDLREFKTQAGDTTRYTYRLAPQHYLDEVFDPRGNRALKAIYEPSAETGQHKFKGIFDALGNRVDDRDFDLRARTGIVRDANGNATMLTFDERGNVLTETDAAGNVTVREYNDPRNPDLETRIIDGNGNVTEQEYDERGNLIEVRELGTEHHPLHEPHVTTFGYNANNDVTSVTDARGSETTFRYQGKNLIEIENANGDIARPTYFANGDVKTFSDFNGNTTTFGDYAGGRPHLVTYADGTKRHLQYNIFGQTTLEELREADGRLTQRRQSSYDSAGRLIEEVVGSEADGSKTVRRLFYEGNLLDWEILVHPDSLNAGGALIENPATPIADRKNSITDYSYDPAGHLVRQVDAEGGIVDFRYDAQGNRIALRDPVGNVTTWVYDALNRPIEERDPLYWDVIRQGNPIYAAMPADDFLNAVAPLIVTAGADPLYDDPSGASWATTTPAPHVTLTAYDPVGNVIGVIDRNARRTEYTPDHAGNVTEERWYSVAGDLVRTLSFTYDATGNMLTANDPDSSYTFVYDALGRQTVADNAGTPKVSHVLLTYGYDAQGNVRSVSDNFGVTVGSTYNNRNLLQTRSWFDAIQNAGSADVDPLRVDFQYDAAGRKTQLDRYRDLAAAQLVGHVHRDYDLASRSKGITFTDALDAAYADYDFGYDALGRMTSDSRAGIAAQYGYDRTGQLLSATRSNGNNEVFTYDLNGNRTLTGYVTGVGNRLLSDGTFTYTYDGEGNRVTKTEIATGTVARYEYDHRNRLTRVTEQAGGAAETELARFVYDALDRRIVVVTADGTTITVNDRQQAWVDFGSIGEVPVRYLYDDTVDVLLAKTDHGGNTSFANTDHLGSIIAYVESNDIVPLAGYLAYGWSLSDLAISRFGFNGREFDAGFELSYYRSRYLDSQTGQFLSEDPIGFASNDANVFRYAFNSPIMNIDPSGRSTVSEYVTFAFQLATPFSTATAIGALIGFLHGFSGANLFYLSEVLAGQNCGGAIDATNRQVEAVKAALTRIRGHLGLTGANGKDFAGAFVSGLGIDVNNVVSDRIGDLYRVLLGETVFPSSGSRVGGFVDGADIAIRRLLSLCRQ